MPQPTSGPRPLAEAQRSPGSADLQPGRRAPGPATPTHAVPGARGSSAARAANHAPPPRGSLRPGPRRRPWPLRARPAAAAFPRCPAADLRRPSLSSGPTPRACGAPAGGGGGARARPRREGLRCGRSVPQGSRRSITARGPRSGEAGGPHSGRLRCCGGARRPRPGGASTDSR